MAKKKQPKFIKFDMPPGGVEFGVFVAQTSVDEPLLVLTHGDVTTAKFYRLVTEAGEQLQAKGIAQMVTETMLRQLALLEMDDDDQVTEQ